MSIFVLLAALNLQTPSFAEVPAQEQRNCRVDAELVGDAMLLFRNAADSWKAETTLTCDSWVLDNETHQMRPSWRFTKPITISFIGNTADYQNVNARVRMRMEILTAREPSAFELARVPVFFEFNNHTLNSGTFETGNTMINITIERDDASSNACMSLASGTLFLRNRNYQAADAGFTSPQPR